MRILHTADWHLGHTLNGWSRETEHAAFLSRIEALLVEEEVDLLLVAGDVYDTVNPSGESQKQLYDALMRFRQARPDLQTILIGGNHDPAGRLEAPASLLSTHGVHVVGAAKRQGEIVDLDRHLVEIATPGGESVLVMAVPFLRAADLPGLSFGPSEAGQSPIVLAARRFYAAMTERAREIADGRPIIAMSHLTVMGGEESEGAERRIMLGGEHAIPIDVFAEDITYVALGHLHRPQSFDAGRVRYSGSCFPLSRSEIDYRHGVSLIELGAQGADHRHIDLAPPARFIELPAAGALSIDELQAELDALDLDPELPVGLRPFLYATLRADGPASVLLAQAQSVIANLPLRLGGISIQREAIEADAAPPVQSLEETNPEALFIEAFERTNLNAPEERHLAAFRDAVAEG